VSGPGFEFLGEQERHNVLAALEGTLTRYRFGRPGEPSFVYQLERDVERRFDVGHCIAVNSGTSALLTALAALGIGPGDEVIVPGYSFIASLSSIVYAGAVPVLAEIDDSLGLDPADVAARITPRTRAIMPVHMLGTPSDLAPLTELARRHGLAVIEDAAQACGGSYRGRRLGTIGDAGAFSLNYFKVITSGEGGLFVTGDEARYKRGYAFHDHGFRPLRDGVAEDDALFGLNLRMGDLAGAVAAAQFDRLDDVLGAARRVRTLLADRIGDLPGVRRRRLPDPDGDCGTTLVYLFDSAEHAARTAKELGTTPLIESGRHYYGNMPQLRTTGAGPGTSCPFREWDGPGPEAYQAGCLPRTDDVLSRAVALCTGASDYYAGTGFGVRVTSSDTEITEAAQRFRAAVAGG
jgi:dTDP-4-amino-4,6-dideoxygalactose transaminase